MKTQKKKILFLYTELAGYTMACLKELDKQESIELFLVHYPVNKEAPFSFTFPPSITHVERSEFTNKSLLSWTKEVNPDVIYCSGWIDKGYRAVCRSFRPGIPVVLGMDNHWTGRISQQIKTVLGKSKVQSMFTDIFIPGEPQLKFAQKLGFKPSNIHTGLYVADVPYFENIYHQIHPLKKTSMPHRFFYMGRYHTFKGVADLWEAFQESVNNDYNWELWCAGTGELNHAFPRDERIKNLGFIQPEQLGSILKDVAVAVIPSHKEPWGVVVQELALSGLPLICSSEVGAASAFLEENVNGWKYDAGNSSELKTCLEKAMHLSDFQLLEMGEESHRKGNILTLDSWVNKWKNWLYES